MQRITEDDGEKNVGPTFCRPHVGYGARQTWTGILIPSFIKCVR